MPLYLRSDIYATGSIPDGWVPVKGGVIKYPVRNAEVLRYLRTLLAGKWQKVIKKGSTGEVHYFEHASGQVAGGQVLFLIAMNKNTNMKLSKLLQASARTAKQKMALFAILNLGIIESLANGLVTAADALHFFFNADNCLFVRKHLRDKTADAIMSRGVQLPDLFEILPAKDAHRELQRELDVMRNLCLKVLDKRQLVA